MADDQYNDDYDEYNDDYGNNYDNTQGRYNNYGGKNYDDGASEGSYEYYGDESGWAYFWSSYWPQVCFVIFMNLGTLGVALAAIIWSAQIFTGPQFWMEGWNGVNGFIGHSPYAWSIAFFCIGAVLIICVIMGCIIAKDVVVEYIEGWRRFFFYTYNTLMSFCFLILAAMAVVSGIFMAMLNANDDTMLVGWQDSVTQNPQNICRIEEENSCAGYFVAQCQGDFSTESNYNCAGHLCIDFCKSNTPQQRVDVRCDACNSQANAGFDFATCRAIEKSFTMSTGCGPIVEDEMHSYLSKVVILACVGAVWVLLTILAMAWNNWGCQLEALCCRCCPSKTIEEDAV